MLDSAKILMRHWRGRYGHVEVQGIKKSLILKVYSESQFTETFHGLNQIRAKSDLKRL